MVDINIKIYLPYQSITPEHFSQMKSFQSLSIWREVEYFESYLPLVRSIEMDEHEYTVEHSDFRVYYTFC